MDFLAMWSLLHKFSDDNIELTSLSLFIKCSIRKLECVAKIRCFQVQRLYGVTSLEWTYVFHSSFIDVSFRHLA